MCLHILYMLKMEENENDIEPRDFPQRSYNTLSLVGLIIIALY